MSDAHKPLQPVLRPEQQAALEKKNSEFLKDWVDAMKDVSSDLPDYPDGAVMRIALLEASLNVALREKDCEAERSTINNALVLQGVEELAVKRARQPQKNGADKTNRQYINARKWVIAEWQRTKHQHLKSGTPSKAAFVRYITEIPATGNSIFRKATRINAARSTIEKRWLKGID